MKSLSAAFSATADAFLSLSLSREGRGTGAAFM